MGKNSSQEKEQREAAGKQENSMAGFNATVNNVPAQNEPNHGFPPPGTPPGAVMIEGSPLPPGGNYSPYARETIPATRTKRDKEPFAATKVDGWLAIVGFLLGFIFVRWAVPVRGVGVTVFTLFYVGVVLLYAHGKGIKPVKESWYWMSILLLTGLSCGLWRSPSLLVLRFFLLFGAAVYWCACLFGGLMRRKTSNYLAVDAISQLFVVPFKNFDVSFLGLLGLRSEKLPENEQKTIKKKKNFLSLLLGLGLCVPVLAILLPMLVKADGGQFWQLLVGIGDWLDTLLLQEMWEAIRQLVLGVPVALYLCGLVAGNAHKRYTSSFTTKGVDKTMLSFRIIPHITVVTVLVMVSGLYLIFMVCQIPYFFSAFSGQRPEGFEVYSLYARSGFFELCRIAAINLGILGVANGFCTVKRTDSSLLRGLNLAICCLTILLIATAFSKMAMYIGIYGLSSLRVMTSVFMIFLALVFGAIMVLQFRYFSILRFTAVVGTLLVSLLCLSGLDGLVARYNADAYLNGKLKEFDQRVLQNANTDGYEVGVEIYEKATEDEKKEEIKAYLDEMEFQVNWGGWGTPTLSDWKVKQAVAKRDLSQN